MEKFWIKDLPEILTSKDFFQDITEREVHRLYAHLAHTQEICGQIANWVNLPFDALIAENAPSDFLDTLELDISIIQSQSNFERGVVVSRWLIHSTWITEIPKSELIQGLMPKTLDAISSPQPNLNSDLRKFRLWLETKNIGLQNTMEMLYLATTLREALANLLAIDIFLTDILLGLNKWRLMEWK
jgi:hypothetical protein